MVFQETPLTFSRLEIISTNIFNLLFMQSKFESCSTLKRTVIFNLIKEANLTFLELLKQNFHLRSLGEGL